MNNKMLIIGGVILAVIVGAVLLKQNTLKSQTGVGGPAEKIMEKDEDEVEKGGVMKKEDEGKMEKDKEVEENRVEIEDFAFEPKTLTVAAGTTVTWVNKDIPGHSATADDRSFDTGVLSQGQSGSVTFSKPGTYTYHCTPHPNMKATIIVE